MPLNDNDKKEIKDFIRIKDGKSKSAQIILDDDYKPIMTFSKNGKVEIKGDLETRSLNVGDSLKVDEKGNVTVDGKSILVEGQTSTTTTTTSDGTFTGNVSVGGTLDVSGKSTFEDDVCIQNSLNVGDGNNVTGTDSIASGLNNTASNDQSVAMGENNTASGNQSVAMGKNNKARQMYSVAMGFNNETSGVSSVAMGYNNDASAHYSVAIGRSNNASGYNSVSMGSDSSGIGDYSVAMGKKNIASGHYSVALGNEAYASGQKSFSMGHGTYVSDYGSFAIGAYNKSGRTAINATTTDNDNVAFVIGNGTTGAESDAFKILQGGKVYFEGDVSFSSGVSDVSFNDANVHVKDPSANGHAVNKSYMQNYFTPRIGFTLSGGLPDITPDFFGQMATKDSQVYFAKDTTQANAKDNWVKLS